MHYFDYAASAPPFAQALETYSQCARACFANPSSTHKLGEEARKALQHAKTSFLHACHARHAKLFLTSGGTESNNLVIRSIMEKNPKRRMLIAADAHASAWFATQAYPGRVEVLPLQKNGHLSLDVLRKYLKKKTILCSAVHACNEIGTVHDIAAYADICQQNGVLLHCDGVQAVGHLPIDFEALDVDFYVFSAHKFGGLRGVGGVISKAAEILPQIRGGAQEYGVRAGTENVAGLAAASAALQASVAELPDETTRLRKLATLFLQKIAELGLDCIIHSSVADGLPGLISLSFPGTIGASLVTELSLRGFAISAGSACHANQIEPSRVVTAIGCTAEQALGTVRISMGRYTTAEATLALAETLSEVVQRQQQLA